MEQFAIMKSTTKSSRNHNEQEILSILGQLGGASRITVKELASRHQVTEATIYRWKKIYGVTGCAKPGLKKFIPIRVAENTAAYVPEASFFAEVKDKAVRFYQPVAPSYLKELLS